MYAPIVVFAYNRPDHLKKVLDGLAGNLEAKECDLFIFIDGPKAESGKDLQDSVKNVAYANSEGKFKKIEVVVADKNQGLAKSVISGVKQVVNDYGRVIVTEDDSVPASSYLKFMNGALDYYSGNDLIWSIGGYTVPMQIPETYEHDVIMTQRSSSYAWATWKDRFELIDWNVSDYHEFRWNFLERKKFNQWGNDRASMLDDQINGRVDSWAIRFDYAMYKHGMYNIIPVRSLIKNIGHDGSGTHTGKKINGDPYAVSLDYINEDCKLECIEIDENIRQQFCKPFQTPRINLIKRYLKNQWLYQKRKKCR